MEKTNTTISDLIMEYFRAHPKEDLEHAPVVDWVEEHYLELYEKKPRDPWRAIRKLYQEGKLIKVKKGVYRYDPDYVHDVELRDFSQKTKEAALKRDGYRCVFCERGEKEGVELTVDHIIPRDQGGTNDVSNAQTLCTQCNLMKKNYSQTGAGKRYFIKIYEKAVANNDERIINFCRCIFNCYDKHEVNSNIRRPNNE